jgi:hypothetical protein
MEVLLKNLQTSIETKSKEVEELRSEVGRVKKYRSAPVSAGNVDVEDIVRMRFIRWINNISQCVLFV